MNARSAEDYSRALWRLQAVRVSLSFDMVWKKMTGFDCSLTTRLPKTAPADGTSQTRSMAVFQVAIPATKACKLGNAESVVRFVPHIRLSSTVSTLVGNKNSVPHKLTCPHSRLSVSSPKLNTKQTSSAGQSGCTLPIMPPRSLTQLRLPYPCLPL